MLVGRAIDGDGRAYEELVRRHQRAALRVAYTIAGPDAQDAVQEAFVKAFRNLHRFRPDAPFRPWVMRIVANEARNTRRSAGRRAALALRVRADDAAGDPEERVVSTEAREELAAAMGRLDERDRLVLAYRWFAEMSESEMAQALGCRAGTVKSRLSRAHERLRAELARSSSAEEVSG